MVSKLSIFGGQRNERQRTQKQFKKRQSSLSISRQPTKAAVSPRFSPLGTSVVKHFNRKAIQCFPASSSFDHFNNCLFSMLECQNYGSLNNANRRITSGRRNYCDRGIGPGWFRFEGSAGTRMPTSCPPVQRCNTDAASWLKGGHPTVADGRGRRWVCFHYGNNCCHWARNIKVRNCGSYYANHLSGTPICSLRYCSTN